MSSSRCSATPTATAPAGWPGPAGRGAGGFAVIDAKTFEVKGRWENGGKTPSFNYDFWYQPRKNALISSEFGEPNAYEPGFDLDDVSAGRDGSKLHFWNLA